MIRGKRNAFTLIELLVVIAIIAVLISILLPALAKAKEEGMKVLCMAREREIGSAMVMYADQNDNLPWTYAHTTTAAGEPTMYPGTNIYSSYTWGGAMARMPWPGDESGDWARVPAELRPLNKYLQVGAQGSDDIKITQCPSDSSAVSPTVGGSGSAEDWTGRTSWQAYGTSYSINWFFLDYSPIPFNRKNLFSYGQKVVNQKVGGAASEFVVMWENHVDQLFPEATPTGGGFQIQGWHKKFSYHTFLFIDGHTEYRMFDTRYAYGAGWRISFDVP